MTHIDDILGLIDAGLGDSPEHDYCPDRRSRCWRCQARPATERMDGACEECASWLVGEGEDPIVEMAVPDWFWRLCDDPVERREAWIRVEGEFHEWQANSNGTWGYPTGAITWTVVTGGRWPEPEPDFWNGPWMFEFGSPVEVDRP